MKNSNLTELVAELGALFDDDRDDDGPSNEEFVGAAHRAWEALREIEHGSGLEVHPGVDVCAFKSDLDGARVIQINTHDAGEFRVNLNDAAIWFGDPEVEESRHEVWSTGGASNAQE